jgi:hypothetical protein
MASANNKALTDFGQALEAACMHRTKIFSSTTCDWANQYQKNAKTIELLAGTIKRKGSVLITGAGKQEGLASIATRTQGWLKTGVQWTNFIEEIDIDIVTSTHYTPLEAALHCKRRQPLLLVHGVYSKVPPCLNKSITIRWSDPFLMKELGGRPNQANLEALIKTKARGPAPYIPAPRNVIFLNAMVMIWLGAKEIAFTGVNPDNPAYFFEDNSELTLEIVRAVSLTSPWLAEWDGRNERISAITRESSHRTHEIIRDIAAQTSAVGTKGRIETLTKGFNLLKDYAKAKNVRIGHFGKSDFLNSLGIERFD